MLEMLGGSKEFRLLTKLSQPSFSDVHEPIQIKAAYLEVMRASQDVQSGIGGEAGR